MNTSRRVQGRPRCLLPTDAFPAVTVPSFLNTGGSLFNCSMVVWGRGCSSTCIVCFPFLKYLEQCLPQSNHPICCCHCSMMQLLLNDARKKRVFDTVAPEDGGQRASFQRMWKDRGKRLNSSWAHPMSLFVIPLEMSPKASHCRRDKSWISLWGWITDRDCSRVFRPRWRLVLCCVCFWWPPGGDKGNVINLTKREGYS